MRGCAHSACLALVSRLRQLGCRVEIDVLGLADRELADYARQRGTLRTLRCVDGAYLLSDMDGDRTLSGDELLLEAGSWIS